MIKITLITIGNEILLGKTVNTNLAFIGTQLSNNGFVLTRELTIPDDQPSIISTLNELWAKSDTVITTGGLGPTRDDITKKSIAEFFQTHLEFREDVWNDIKLLYRRKNKPIPEIVKTQAQVPQGFNVIRNSVGTAPGMHFQTEEKNFFALPGVPYEMKPMVTEYILPFLRKKYGPKEFYCKTIRTIGILEAEISQLLDDIKSTPNTNIAFLPKLGLVDIRIYGNKKDEFQKIISTIKERLSEHIYGYDDDTVVGLCHEKLMHSGKKLAVAESCTGGLIQNLFTNNQGSSNYLEGGVVSYSNDAKMKLLGVKESTLRKFGAVSKETVKEMLEGVRALFDVDYAIAVSGIAGPTGGTREKPVGLVYIGVNIEGKLLVKRFNFSGDRLQIKKQSAENAIYLLLKRIS
jgi:nicotinamide-nucleotide amidase